MMTLLVVILILMLLGMLPTWPHKLLGFGGSSGFDLRGLATAVSGALLLPFAYRQLRQTGQV